MSTKTIVKGIPGRAGLRDGEELIMGPFGLFDGSFILEFYSSHPSRDASVLMRGSYIASHPLSRLGKQHPQSPPLHIHFNQKETFEVVQGRLGTTDTYATKDHIWVPADGQQIIHQNEPHRFWPVVDSTDEDAIFTVWAHPTAVEGAMDHVFFYNVLGYLSDLYETKSNPSILQMCLLQHPTESTLVMFPTATVLGPLRWWIPWTVQGIFARIAKACGYQELMPEYTTKEQWAAFQRAKQA